MNIYKLDNKGIRKLMVRFTKTIYGKTVFLIAYSLPIIIFIGLILIALFMNKYIDNYYMLMKLTILLQLGIFANITTLLVGSAYYYHELKEFCNKENN